MGGATSSRKVDDLSYFRSPDIGARIIDVSDSRSFTLYIFIILCLHSLWLLLIVRCGKAEGSMESESETDAAD